MTVPYRGRTLEEMDLDAILARRPALVLVDELAHTNAPGSRHPKRYLDIEELLAVGIDVYTTVNIQHVESLNDIVAQITRVRVRETVPDSIIDRADEIEVVDITPGDLIERLKQGKVYMPATARSAVENYFKPGNLTALRELALRCTAQRVDEQLVSHMRENAIEGPWAAGDRVFVCVDEAPRSLALVRYGRRLAERLRAPWSVSDDRDGALGAPVRGRTRPAGEHHAAGRGAGGGGRHAARPRCRRGYHALCARAQRHPCRRRALRQGTLARMARGLGHA